MMRNFTLFISALLLASSAFAADSRFYPTKDGGVYEATLRKAGIPQSGGLVWTVASPTRTSGPAARAR